MSSSIVSKIGVALSDKKKLKQKTEDAEKLEEIFKTYKKEWEKNPDIGFIKLRASIKDAPTVKKFLTPEKESKSETGKILAKVLEILQGINFNKKESLSTLKNLETDPQKLISIVGIPKSKFQKIAPAHAPTWRKETFEAVAQLFKNIQRLAVFQQKSINGSNESLRKKADAKHLEQLFRTYKESWEKDPEKGFQALCQLIAGDPIVKKFYGKKALADTQDPDSETCLLVTAGVSALKSIKSLEADNGVIRQLETDPKKIMSMCGIPESRFIRLASDQSKIKNYHVPTWRKETFEAVAQLDENIKKLKDIYDKQKKAKVQTQD